MPHAASPSSSRSTTASPPSSSAAPGTPRRRSRRWLAALLIAAWIAAPWANQTWAAGSGRSYSSGGGSRSSSSGSRSSSSSSRPSSSGSSSFGSRPSSSGSSSSFGSRPSSSGRSYSSGSSPGSTFSSSPNSSPSNSGGFSNPSSSSRPGSSIGTHPGETSGFGSKPRGADPFDSLAGKAQRQEQSRAAFQKGQSPKATFTDSAGQTQKLDPTDRRVDDLRRQLDQERWVNRDARQRSAFGGYYGSVPMYSYHDPYSNIFWTWLLVQSLDTRANYAYNHRDSMDSARYQEMLAKDAELKARVQALEAENRKRDPGYVPPGIKEPDLMYDDEFVNAAYNPQPTATAYGSARPVSRGSSLFNVLLFLAIMGFVIWLVFFKRWGGSSAPRKASAGRR